MKHRDRVKLMGGVTVPRTFSMAFRLSSEGFYPRREPIVVDESSNYIKPKLDVVELRENRRAHTFSGKHEWRRNYVNRVDREKEKMHRNLIGIERRLELRTMEEYDGFDSKERHTNDVLQSYDFVSLRERNQLFLAYGKDAVRQGLDLFYIFDVQPNKDMVVATIDMVAREGYANTGRIFYNGGDVVADVRRHYWQSASIKPIGTEVSRDSLIYLVRKYIFGEDAEQPEPIVVKVEPTAKKTSPYVTEFSRYSTEDVKNFSLVLAKDGLTLEDVMEEGIFVKDVEGYHLIFNEVLALLAGRGLKPNEFPVIEKIHELNRIISKNSGIEYVRLTPVQTNIVLQLGKEDLMNLLYGKHRDNPFKASDKFEQ